LNRANRYNKINNKVFPYQHCEGIQKGQRYSSTLTSGLDGCQRLTSHPAQFNPGKEPWYPRAGLVVFEKRNIFVPATIRTLDHPDGGIYAVHTTTLRLPKYHPKTSFCHVTILIETHPLCRRQGQPQSQSELVQKI
jgi:hypothetical protein